MKMSVVLPDSKVKIKFKSISMATFEDIANSEYGINEKGMALIPYIPEFIEEISDEHNNKISKKIFNTWYKTLSAKDGIVIITKVQLIMNEINLVLAELGILKEREDLRKKLQIT